MSIPDDFILTHNRSTTPGVYYMTLRGSKDYSVILDSREHSLFLYVDSSTGQNFMHHINSKACRRKLIHVLRDKFNEADRPFIPSFFNSVLAYDEYFTIKPIELRPAMLVIKDNKPVYPVYPVFSLKDHPLTTLLLRIRPIFDFLVTQNDILSFMMNSDSTPKCDIGIIEEILKRSGQLVLTSISLFKTEETTVDKLMPKISSEIGFRPFEYITEIEHTVNMSEIDEIFRYYSEFPEYLIVKVDRKVKTIPRMFQTYKLMAMVDRDGVLYEYMDKWFMINNLKYTVLDDVNDIEPVYLLLRNSSLLSCSSEQSIKVVGEYVRPEVTEKVIVPFRTPVSCKQTSIEECVSISYPCYVQKKFDGNRTIVYSLLGGSTILFYSRSGYKLSKSFNERFTTELQALSKHICEKLKKPLANIHFDFECYDHGTIHSEIAGLCNAKSAKPGFEKLRLHLLSCFIIDDIRKYEERKREYTSSQETFREIIQFSNSLGLPSENDESSESYQTLCVSESRLIKSYQDLCSFMKESVNNKYEGLVIYPLSNYYVFGHDRLMKLKKIYDGEVVITDFIESDIEPGAIGSVMVKSRAYFDKSEEVIDYRVTASLKKEFKENSMHNKLFKSCIGKFFTIICDSFSNTGVPMHARFKMPLHPDSARDDVDDF